MAFRVEGGAGCVVFTTGVELVVPEGVPVVVDYEGAAGFDFDFVVVAVVVVVVGVFGRG